MFDAAITPPPPTHTHTHTPPPLSAQFRVLDALREKYFCILKRFLFLSIFVSFVSSLSIKHTFCAFFGYPYHWNSTNMFLDAGLNNGFNTAEYFKFDSNSQSLFSAYISVKIIFVATNDSIGLMFNITFPLIERKFKCKLKMNEGVKKLTRRKNILVTKSFCSILRKSTQF